MAIGYFLTGTNIRIFSARQKKGLKSFENQGFLHYFVERIILIS